MKDCFSRISCVFPSGNVSKVFVVALCLSFVSLVFFSKVPTTRFVSVKCISCKKLSQFHIISNTKCFFKFLIQSVCCSRNFYFFPEFFTKNFNFFHCFRKSLSITCHTHFVPHYFP